MVNPYSHVEIGAGDVPSRPKSSSSLVDVSANFCLPASVAAAAGKFELYVQPPIDKRTLRFRFLFLSRNICFMHP
jgi:hypothetical protein